MDHKYQIYVNQAITNMEFNINYIYFFENHINYIFDYLDLE